MKVYTRIDGKLRTYSVDTSDHIQAIGTVQHSLMLEAFETSKATEWTPALCLAVVQGGAQQRKAA